MLGHLDMKVKLLGPDARVPTKGDPDAACFDLYSVDEMRTIAPGQRVAIDTGLAMNIPRGWAGFIEPRSGLALKQGLMVMGGVIDASYRGEIKVILHNAGFEYVRIERGDRIAQMHFRMVPDVDFQVVNELDATERGAGGFGSTGR